MNYRMGCTEGNPIIMFPTDHGIISKIKTTIRKTKHKQYKQANKLKSMSTGTVPSKSYRKICKCKHIIMHKTS